MLTAHPERESLHSEVRPVVALAVALGIPLIAFVVRLGPRRLHRKVQASTG